MLWITSGTNLRAKTCRSTLLSPRSRPLDNRPGSAAPCLWDNRTGSAHGARSHPQRWDMFCRRHSLEWITSGTNFGAKTCRSTLLRSQNVHRGLICIVGRILRTLIDLWRLRRILVEVDSNDQGNGAKAFAARIEMGRWPVQILSLKRSISLLMQSWGQISELRHVDRHVLAQDLAV